MIETLIYKFKKRQLTDSPPNIEIGEDNWDKAEYELSKQSEQIDVLNNDRGYLTTKSAGVIDVNTLVENGRYRGDRTSTNIPEVNHWVLDVIKYDHNFIVQIIHFHTTRKMYKRQATSSGIWGEWQELATTTKTDISFPYNPGYSDYDSSYGTLLSKNSLNEVILNIYSKPTSGTFETSTVKIGTLPVGYRPKKNIEINARTSSGIGTLTLYTTGAVNVTMASGISSYISGTFVFNGI